MSLRNLVHVAMCASTLLMFGCTSGGKPDIIDDTGSLAVNWTIGNQRTVNLCEAYKATGVEIQIEEPNGIFVREMVVPCNQFEASLELEPGDYTATIVLINGERKPVSNRIDLGTFTVQANAEVTRDASFAAPPSS